MCYDARSDRAAIGKRIRKRMNAYGVSSAELAKLAGCSQPMITDILNGEKNPPLSILRVIAARLDAKIDDFVH